MRSFHVGIKSIFMVVLVLAFLIPINVFAQGPFYAALKPGIYSPQSNDLDGYQTGFNGEVVLGYRFTPNIAAEVGIGYFNTEGEETVGGATYVGREFDFHVYSVAFTLKAILPYKKWEFFGLGGAGVYIVSTPYDSDYYDEDNYDAVLGGYWGAGIHYHITPKIFVGVEGKYLWTDKAKIQYEESGPPLEVELKMDGIIATAVFGIRF